MLKIHQRIKSDFVSPTIIGFIWMPEERTACLFLHAVNGQIVPCLISVPVDGKEVSLSLHSDSFKLAWDEDEEEYDFDYEDEEDDDDLFDDSDEYDDDDYDEDYDELEEELDEFDDDAEEVEEEEEDF